MEIVLPEPRGFCAGVDMAIETLERAISLLGTPIFCYHQIVHNTHVVAAFEARGVVFVDAISEVPRRATVVFSAHGVSPAVRAEAELRGLRVVDATCPLVSKVHAEARGLAAKGYAILFIGHHDHDEVAGVLGEVGDALTVIASVEEAERIDVPSGQPVAYLTQTTMGVGETARIVAALRRRFPAIEGPGKQDICYATENRQAAVVEVSSQADLVLVVGSRNSSNSQRLVDTARECGTPAYLVDGPAGLDESWFSDAETVVVSAGASVPELYVQEVVRWVSERFPVSVRTAKVKEEEMFFRLPTIVR